MRLGKRKNKLNARKVEYDGHKFDSAKEKNRYIELVLLMKAGEIYQLRVHPKYPLNVNGKKIGEYWADFEYVDKDGLHVEDVKGYKGGCTWNLFRFKAKLFHVLYGIEVEVI